MSLRERRWPEVEDGGIAGAGAHIGVRHRRRERVEQDEERLEAVGRREACRLPERRREAAVPRRGRGVGGQVERGRAVIRSRATAASKVVAEGKESAVRCRTTG
jgi:hypothetical protein